MDAFRRFLLAPIKLLNTNSNNATFKSSKLSKQSRLKLFEVRHVKILREPGSFYNELREQIKCTKKQVSLASLYLGTGGKEIGIRNDLCKLIKRNHNIRVRVLVDKNRGTRPDRESGASTASLCTPLLQAVRNNGQKKQNPINDCNVQIKFFQMPHAPDASRIRIFLESFLPPRFNEMFQTFHMKAYVFDDTVILSGANLSTDYFTNRQDRYFVINCPELARFYHKMIEIIGRYSYTLQLLPDENGNHGDNDNAIPFKLDVDTNKNTSNDEYKENHDPQSKTNLKKELENLIHINEEDYKQCIDKCKDATTICAPTIQFKALGIDHDEQVTCSFLSNVPTINDRLNIASGYLNFTDTYTKLMASGDGSTHVLTASPKANGFYNANGISGSLPLAYSLLQQRFMETFKLTRKSIRVDIHNDDPKNDEVKFPDALNMYEYNRENWTFHGKGMWYIPNENSNPLRLESTENTIKDKLPTGTIIGSPNYGWRSVMRDSESQIFLHTYDRKLQQALSDEWNSMEKESVAVDENVFKVSGRHTDQYFSWKQGHWIGIGSRLVKTFM